MTGSTESWTILAAGFRFGPGEEGLMTTSLDPAVEGLEPRALWARFDEIRQIPRPSRREERIRAYVLEMAERHGCPAKSDAAGNIVIRVPATAGYEKAPTVVLQGHMDMVCEKDAGTSFDFLEDPIQLSRNGDRLTAQGTTLGADNGIAVAAGLALMTDPGGRHGPLELLFTVDEETGLNGVRKLDPKLVGGKILINLDSEDEGVITIACAGARSAELILPLAWELPSSDGEALILRFAGATGGHSGGDIHQNRANPIRLLADTLTNLEGVGLASISGGSVRNALAREAEALVFGDPSAVAAAVKAAQEQVRLEFSGTDPALRVEAIPAADPPSRIMSSGSQSALLELLRTVPHGVIAMSEELPGLVQTSCNLATVQTGPQAVTIHCSIRSSLDHERDATVDQVVKVGQALGARAEAPEGYPGWRPNPASPLLERAVKVWRKLRGEDPVVTGVHGGLECGVIGGKILGMDMISIGPDIANPHSPSEEISVSSTRRVLGDYLTALLASLAEPPFS